MWYEGPHAKASIFAPVFPELYVYFDQLSLRNNFLTFWEVLMGRIEEVAQWICNRGSRDLVF